MFGYSRVAPRYENELPRMIRESGYYAVGIGKMHFHPQRNTHGYDKTILDESGRVESKDFVSDYRQWFKSVAPELDPDATGIGWNDHRAKPYVLPERLHPTRWTGDQAVEFLEGYQDDRAVSAEGLVRPAAQPLRRAAAMVGALPGRGPARARCVGDWAERHAQRGKPHSDSLWQGDLGPEAPRLARQGYYGNVSFIDEQIGRILEVLRKRGWLDNTLILFTADHGDMLGDHHLWRKTYGYEPSARIPMLVRWPEWMPGSAGPGPRPAGRASRRPARRFSMPPGQLRPQASSTAGACWSWSAARPTAGASTSTWSTPRATPRRTIGPGLTDGRIKYIYYAPDGRQQLFDLVKDPHETRDLSAVPEAPSCSRRGARRMVEHLAERGEPFVVDGDLGIRKKRTLFSPNYPKGKT